MIYVDRVGSLDDSVTPVDVLINRLPSTTGRLPEPSYAKSLLAITAAGVLAVPPIDAWFAQ